MNVAGRGDRNVPASVALGEPGDLTDGAPGPKAGEVVGGRERTNGGERRRARLDRFEAEIGTLLVVDLADADAARKAARKGLPTTW